PLRRVGDPAPGEDLLRDRHRAWTTTGAGRRSRVHAFIGLRGARASAPLAGRCGTRLELRLEWRDRDLALEPRDVVLEEPAVFDDLTRDRVDALGEGREFDLLASADPIDQREVRRGQDPEVLAVFVVDPLDVLRDDDADPSHQLRVRRLFARTALAAPLPADRADEAALLDAAARDRELAAGLQPEIREEAERLVEVVADVGGRDLVGRDLVPEPGADRVAELEVLAFELTADQVGVVHEEEDAAFETQRRGAFPNVEAEEVSVHGVRFRVGGCAHEQDDAAGWDRARPGRGGDDIGRSGRPLRFEPARGDPRSASRVLPGVLPGARPAASHTHESVTSRHPPATAIDATTREVGAGEAPPVPLRPTHLTVRASYGPRISRSAHLMIRAFHPVVAPRPGSGSECRGCRGDRFTMRSGCSAAAGSVCAGCVGAAGTLCPGQVVRV